MGESMQSRQIATISSSKLTTRLKRSSLMPASVLPASIMRLASAAPFWTKFRFEHTYELTEYYVVRSTYVVGMLDVSHITEHSPTNHNWGARPN